MIVDYYLGKGEDSLGNKISDYLSYSDSELEDERDYVPWVFPLPESMPGWANSPLLTEADVTKFRDDQLLKEMVRSSVNRYLKFLSNTYSWRNTASHNHIRITRMIRFLATIGLKEEAQKVAKWCSERGGSKISKANWTASVDFKPPWERVEENKEEQKEETPT